MQKRRLFITGSDGFTGVHLIAAAIARGWHVGTLKGDLDNLGELGKQIAEFKPTAVMHLAAISAVTHADLSEIYRVNVIGTENLLKVLVKSRLSFSKIILASSAAVYGNSTAGLLSETTPTKPVSHYGISKLAMEYAAATYFDRLPIVLARPFNYTGVGHDERFVVPKIVGHFLRKNPVIELGDLEVEREFNDVRFVVDAYLTLLEQGQPEEVYNICSGRPIKLTNVIQTLKDLTGFDPHIKVNPAFLRENEVQLLAGDSAKLYRVVHAAKKIPLVETLRWMIAGAA